MPRNDRNWAVRDLRMELTSCDMKEEEIDEWLTLFRVSPNTAAHEIREIARLLSRVRSLVKARTQEQVKRETTNSLILDVQSHFARALRAFAGKRYLIALPSTNQSLESGPAPSPF